MSGKKYIDYKSHSRVKIKVTLSDSLIKILVDDLLNSLQIGPNTGGKIVIKDNSESYEIASKEIVNNMVKI